MKNNTKIYNRFKGFTLEDCDCRYCLYYGGRRKGKVNCLADECVWQPSPKKVFAVRNRWRFVVPFPGNASLPRLRISPAAVQHHKRVDRQSSHQRAGKPR